MASGSARVPVSAGTERDSDTNSLIFTFFDSFRLSYVFFCCILKFHSLDFYTFSLQCAPVTDLFLERGVTDELVCTGTLSLS